ncbi:hypothetical protein [Mesohalobacter halotolerans]|uniref:Lipocalin-like domain-containing protein n=1 Tax=Mesohalobacter halotolerans TaxID=1883405 RepID=A0A4U5TV44_9FLAO|nr:hypothetical protein [Mesohalobacter halotolerans]MBS3738248.1 hypothetical protein [Psychroflexus sp.]TKS57434.1 hypothetical protein FCN74_03165 [Mesohalobacter halotolerans]
MKNQKVKFSQTVFKLGVLVLLFFILSCSDDDSSTNNTSSVEVPDGVPSGVIVPADERTLALTGFDQLSGEQRVDIQKRWNYNYGEINSDDCPEQSSTLSGDYYVAFTPSGVIEYTDEGGNQISSSREWEFNGDKTGVVIQGVVFYFSELNNNGLKWWSEQSSGGCTTTTFEVMHEPIFD